MEYENRNNGQCNGLVGASNSFSSMGEAAQTSPPRPINEAQQVLDKALSALGQELSTLADRLAPVLGPDHPKDNKERPQPIRNGGVSARIFDSAESVSAYIQHIRNLRDRLEV